MFWGDLVEFFSWVIKHFYPPVKQKFPEHPDITTFPSIQSTPEALLSFTSSLFSRWLNLDCAFGEHHCIFPITSQEHEDDYLNSEEGNIQEQMEDKEQMEEHRPIAEGEKGKLQLDPGLTSGYTKLCFPGVSQWTLFFLWIATCACVI